MNLRNIAALSVSMLALVASAPAWAQTKAPDDPNEIVVTATRESTLLSKTPIAMSAITGEGLRDAGITNPTNLQNLVPNLSIDRGNNGIQITIRGVTSSDSTEKGDPSASFLVNGIYIARQQAQEVSFYDLDRVEVLRGPQGTLYGRNTTAGVINLISARPKDTLGGSIDTGYGNYNAVNVTGAINLPVSTGLAVRAAVNYDRRNSFMIAGVASPFTFNPFKDNFSGRLSALAKLGESATLLLVADYSSQKGAMDNQVLLSNFYTGAPVIGVGAPYVNLGSAAQRTLTYAEPQQSMRDNSTWGISGELTWDLGPVEMTYLGSYRNFKRNELYNTHVFQGGDTATTFVGDYNQNSHELRFAFGKGSPLHGQFGGYYFKENSNIANVFLSPALLGIPAIGGVGALTNGFYQGPLTSESKAAFGQLTYDLTPELHLTAGLRYSHDNKTRVGQTKAIYPSPIGTVVSQNNQADVTFSKTTWRVGIDYDAPNLGLIYASVSTGYKAGGFNGNCLVGSVVPAGTPACVRTADTLYYLPETLTAYEAGFKFKFAGGKLRLNGSAFHYDYANLQLNTIALQNGTNVLVVKNAAGAKVDGAELDAVVEASPNDRFTFSVNWLHARYSDFSPSLIRPSLAAANLVVSTAVGAPVPLAVNALSATQFAVSANWAGLDLDRSPRITASAGYTHIFQLGNGGEIQAGARIRISDSYKLATNDSLFQLRQPSYTKSDATLTYNAPERRWYVQAYINNIENKVTVQSTVIAGASPVATFSDPRTFGARAGFKF